MFITTYIYLILLVLVLWYILGPKIAISVLKTEYKKIETKALFFETFDTLKKPFRSIDKKMLGRGDSLHTNELIRTSVAEREREYLLHSQKQKQEISVLLDAFNRKLIEHNEITFDQLDFLLTKQDRAEIANLNKKAQELSSKY